MEELKHLLFLAPKLNQRNIATVAESAGFKVTFVETLDDALSFYPHSSNLLFVPEQLLLSNPNTKEHFLSSVFSQFGRIVYDSSLHNDSELQYLSQNIAGVLGKGTGIDLSLKALKVLSSGEKWFSRQTLEKAINSTSFNPLTAKRHTHPAINSNLSLKEKLTLELLSQGLSNQEIAKEMQISENTVKAHISSLSLLL